MADFASAIAVVLHHEGGYVCDPDDPGGATKYGVTAASLGTWLGLGRDATCAEVQALTVDEAKEFYRRRFWNRGQYGFLHDQRIATKLFDAAVNMGPSQAHRIFQRALGDVEWPVTVDGVIGPATIAAANRAPADSLLITFAEQLADFYRALAADKPVLAKFLGGWLKRAKDGIA
jgi:lysozyme family protein